ncbi:hypothetical protein EZV62_003846 [Acer yangbiense]|uniref:apyrase n=1 Tax=Acer yangbiense TaxID=1000413 RepID=A0A5C7IIF5_9ROSI|nr:hypothetical protein EZV62_003846 [Acer yangbiense]
MHQVVFQPLNLLQFHITEAGLPPEASSAHRFGFTNSGHKNNLRLSSSLQDFSVYRRLDPEEADLDLGIDRYAQKPHPLQRENPGSSFSKEKALQGATPFTRRKCVRMFMVFLSLILFAFLVYMVSMYIFSNWYQGGSKFYVVLDCGSTGTRVYVYQASVNRRRDGSLPIFLNPLTEGLSRKAGLQSGRAYDQMETEPGFDKLVHNISGLKQIPEHAHKTTSIFIYATAGVRRLPNIKNADLVNGKIEIKHPCLHSGYKEQYICSRCASSQPESASPVIGGKHSDKGGKSGTAVLLTGAPNWEECSALAKAAVNLSEWSNLSPGMDCDLQPCALADSLPRPYGQFYAMSGTTAHPPHRFLIFHLLSGSIVGVLLALQFDSSTMGSFWSPHRSQMHLQSRRSQSREDLNSSLAKSHIVKV